MKIEIGSILKKFRKKHKVNQADLAKYLLISRPTYLRYEQNTIEIPLSKLFEVAKFYNVDIIDLIRLIEMEKSKKDVNFAPFNEQVLIFSAQAI
ncbi:XRE family transcriptional regulator [Pedobacter frigiditerrae]|uniref:XRE family transcriptional regulator n=1 Tax=Pedobacter frigiditerrae TaxID=2530452 RepID=A0A4R0MXT1_9SPHI|nr:helix-turn-helix transcriptional regulator [Pedobacter frigiditerrae]TCC91697.1 XRE family transcriptional regulator [Pedobacter frigiditerrae]